VNDPREKQVLRFAQNDKFERRTAGFSLKMTNFKTDDRPTESEITTEQTGREVMTEQTYNLIKPEQGVPMEVQKDPVEVVHTLRHVVCVKG
jgi:hypothetical protein